MTARGRGEGGQRLRGAGRRDGYTLIEVIMALGVLTAGAVGIMALQQAATRGNFEARQMTTGSQVAQRWVERLRRDGLSWTTGDNAVPVSALLLANTTYLSEVPAPAAPAPWFVPVPAVGSPESAMFDYYGVDTDEPDEAHYCTNVRLEWLFPGRAMRADVRVWWRRSDSGGVADATSAALVGCAQGVDPNTLGADFRVRMVYASTVIRYVARR